MKREGSTIERATVNRLDEAADWFLRLQDLPRAEADYEDWLRWCDADPDNLSAFEQVQRRWRDLDALKVDAATRGQETNPALAGGRHARARSRDSITAWSIAASIAAIALLFGVIQTTRFQPAPAPQQLTAALTNRAATLPDGSRMILGAQSRVDMDFNGPRRQLDLSAGEAYFKVKHDETRPFVVQAGDVSVTAIGTAFDVRRDPDKVTITVEEGTVEVSSHAPGGKAQTWRAEAGYQVIYSSLHRTASIASVNSSVELAWRNGELAYLYEPLGSVIEDLNRYSSRKIVIADPQVAQIPFTGTAFASSLDGWLAGIEQAYPVSITRTASGDIVLSARREGE